MFDNIIFKQVCDFFFNQVDRLKNFPGVLAKQVLDEQLVLISPPNELPSGHTDPSQLRYRTLKAIEFQELANLPLILPMKTHALRKILDAYQASERVSFQIHAEANSVTQLIEIVAAGLAHSILSFSSVRDHVISRRISARKIIAPEISRPVYLCSSKTHTLSFSQMAVGEQILKMLKRSETIET